MDRHLRAVPLVLFVLTYKLGEFAIGPMVKPFGSIREDRFRDRTGAHNVGIVLSVAGSLTEALLFRARNVPWNLGAGVAAGGFQSRLRRCCLGRTRSLRSLQRLGHRVLTGGLGTAAFLAF